MVHHLGSDPARSYPPAGHSERRILVHVWLGPHQEYLRLYGPSGYIRTAYTYAPYGEVTANGDVAQPIQWSSEAWDEELGLIYYNWRYYQAFLGKWTTRDPFHEMYDINLYSFIRNNINNIDSLGTKIVKGTLPLWRGSGTVAFSFDVSFRRNCVEVTLVLDLAGRDSSIEKMLS